MIDTTTWIMVGVSAVACVFVAWWSRWEKRRMAEHERRYQKKIRSLLRAWIKAHGLEDEARRQGIDTDE